MLEAPGHETGHAGHLADAFTWREYVHGLRTEHGGWKALATALQDRAEDEVAEDPDSVVKGLKRLARNRQRPGGKYGDLLLRLFGLSSSIEQWGRLLGQYHSRFADLPVGLRREQLLRWDRPPVSETPSAMWVHIGLASLAHRDRDLVEVRRRVALASGVPRPEPGAKLELALLQARLASDDGDLETEDQALRRVHSLLTDEGPDALCYQARYRDQLAYRASRDWRTRPAALREALAHYEAIPAGDVPPFVAFRRAVGRAWCLWRLGEVAQAAELAALAAQHAGDGAFIRLRVMALSLQANIAGDTPHGRALHVRAVRLSAGLDDADLAARVASHPPGSATPSTP